MINPLPAHPRQRGGIKEPKILTLSSVLADNFFCILFLLSNLSLHRVCTFKLVFLTVAT